MFSENGQYRLFMQDDGNLVLYKEGVGVLWNAGTNGRAVKYALMGKDGNLVLIDYSGNQVWQSGTSSVSNIDSALTVQDDGNLVINRPNTTVVWNTSTFERNH
jgi:hypothetical protein